MATVEEFKGTLRKPRIEEFKGNLVRPENIQDFSGKLAGPDLPTPPPSDPQERARYISQLEQNQPEFNLERLKTNLTDVARPVTEPLRAMGRSVTNPIVASTMASLAAPQLAAPAQVAKLGPFMTSLFQNLPAIGASTVAGGTAETARQLAEGKNLPEAAQKGLQTGGEFLMGDVAGLGVANVAKKALQPGAKFLTEQGKNLIKFAQDNGLKLNPAAVAPSKTNRAIDHVTDAFLPSRVAKRFANKKIAKVLTTNLDEGNDIIRQSAMIDGMNSPGVEKVIPNAKKAIENALQEWTPKVEAKYNKVSEALGGKNAWTDYPLVREAMDQIRAEQKKLVTPDENVLNFIRRFKKKFPGQVNMDDFFKEFQRLGKVRGADKKSMGMLRDAFKAQMESLAPDAKVLDLIQDANVSWALGKDYFKNNDLINKIVKGTVDPDKVTVQLFRDGQYGVLKQLQANIPEKDFNNLMRLNLESIIKNTARKEIDGVPFDEIVNGKKLLKWIDDNPKTFNLYPKETQEAFKNFALYAKFHGKEAIEGAKGITDALGKSAMITGGLGSLGFAGGVDPTGAGVMVPGSLATLISIGMMKPGSMTNRWLTTGVPFGKKAAETLKLGGRAVFGEDDGE